jgi:hypothetical protein
VLNVSSVLSGLSCMVDTSLRRRIEKRVSVREVFEICESVV